jgi:thiol-disulfide isomerase/thioredoxin
MGAATPPAERPAGYVALVDDELILRDEFARVQAIDLAMSTLLGIAPAEPTQILQQMINNRLVMRQAIKAGAAPADVSPYLAALLAANGKTQADLDTALELHSIGRTQFDEYLAELILVDQFARQSAAGQEIAVDAYVAGLQGAARIHLGDALTTITAVAPSSGTATPRVATPTMATQAGMPATSAAPAPPAWTRQTRGVAVGQLAPLFDLEVLAGGGRRLAHADLLGSPAVLSFWTTWCPYCLRQTPVMVTAAARYAGKGIQFVGVDVSENADAVAAYVAEHAIPYPILLDLRGEVAATYAVEGYPTTYFLDAEGRIAAHHIGALSEDQRTQYVEQLLGKK